MLYTVCLALFLLIIGLSHAGVPLPHWTHVIGGICGVIAGAVLLVGIL